VLFSERGRAGVDFGVEFVDHRELVSGVWEASRGRDSPDTRHQHPTPNPS
jgi:hypothetical protein